MPTKKDIEEIKKDIEKYINEKYPSLLEGNELEIKAISEVDINDTNIQNLVYAIYFVFLRHGLDSCTQLYILVSQFAESFKEKSACDKLDSIWQGTEKYKIPIPSLEEKIMKNYYTVQPMPKKFSYKGNIYTTSDLNSMLQYAKKRIFSIFNQIYIKHNLAIKFTMPHTMMGNENSGEMPVL